MEEIIKVSCDDKEFNIKINGENLDLYTAIAEIIKVVSRQRGVTGDTSVRIIRKIIEEEE